MSGWWIVYGLLYTLAIVVLGMWFGGQLATHSAPLPEEHEGRDAA